MIGVLAIVGAVIFALRRSGLRVRIERQEQRSASRSSLEPAMGVAA
jgi:hypothetical protein